MRIHDVEQGSDAWKALRAGKPTASCFARIVTNGGAKSDQMEKYENHLVAELLIGKPVEEFDGTDDTARGTELEPDAANFYAMTNGIDLIRVGFVTDDEETMGCSPDRFIAEDGILEIKVPKASTHVGYMLQPATLPKKYYSQVQGQLWITGRKYADIISYHPEMKPVVERIRRDEGFISALSRHVSQVIGSVSRKRQHIQEAA